MLGAPCSPCCGGCTPEALRAVYDRIRAASCSVSLSGDLPRQDAAVRFEPAIGAFYSYTESQVVAALGSWYRWDAFQCPSTLSLALASSSFSEPLDTTSPTTAQVVFSGNSDPSPALYRSRVQVLLTIRMRSGTAGEDSAPLEGPRRYSLIPGTQSCYMWAGASIQVDASGMTAGSGRLPVSAVSLGNVFVMGPQNAYPAYAYSIPSPYYHFPAASQPQQVIPAVGPVNSVTDAGTPSGTAANLPFGEWNAIWDSNRSLEFESGASVSTSSNQFTGGAGMDIYADDALLSDAANVLAFSLESQNAATFSSYGFGRWVPNAEQSPTWGSSMAQPVLVDPNDIQPPYFVRFSYQAADKKFVDSPPASPFVTSLGVTLS